MPEVKVDGLMAEVRLSISGQVITCIITADAAEMGGKRAVLLRLSSGPRR